MGRLSRFLALGAREKLFLLRSLAAVTAIRLALYLIPYERLRQSIASPACSTPASLHELQLVAWAVGAVSRFVPGATCLTQALAGQYLLARKGKHSEIKIGIERDSAPALKAHAWLVSGDHVVLGGPAHLMAKYHFLEIQ